MMLSVYPSLRASHHLLISLSWLFMCYCFTHPTNGINNQILISNNIGCLDKERDALLNFKQGIEEDTCKVLTSWGLEQGSRDCCSWPGVRCSNRTGRVIMLDLHGIKKNSYDDCVLKGKLSPSLGKLKHLKFLDLSSNYFQSSIPTFLGSFSKLKHLNLSNNQFAGEIPYQLGHLSRLTLLDISNNFHLESHSLHWLSHLTLLRHLNLRNTYLIEATDWFQAINSLPSISVLHLDLCLLPSIFHSPFSYINSSTSFDVITLAGNFLNDTLVFQWLLNLSQINTHPLVHVDLSLNSFSGPIPSAFGQMHSLTYLDLSNNQLEGPIPSAIGNMSFLSYLDLSYNRLEGLIPDTIGNLKSLAYLKLSNNSFSGPIPNTVGNLSCLTYLKLSNNLLSSSIPDTIRNLEFLEYLDLSNNSLSSTIPKSLEYMLNLKYLDLSHNLFTGAIPSQLDKYGILNSLDLSFNNLSGPIPSALWRFDIESFSGNGHLCGQPLSGKCSAVKGGVISPQQKEHEASRHHKEHIRLYASAALGLFLGFFGVCGTMVFKQSWRVASFKWIDYIRNKIYDM